jgi:hypothetical protein
MKKYFLHSTLVLGLLLSFPSASHAFKVLDASTYRLDAHTALFTITYEFGFLNADLWMPMAAKEGSTASDFHVTYEVTDASGAPIRTTNAGVVLSGATLEENGDDAYRYSVSKKERASFMLIGLVTSQNPLPSGATLSVTSLPFAILKDGERKPTGQVVEQSVLSEYKTRLEV